MDISSTQTDASVPRSMYLLSVIVKMYLTMLARLCLELDGIHRDLFEKHPCCALTTPIFEMQLYMLYTTALFCQKSLEP